MAPKKGPPDVDPTVPAAGGGPFNPAIAPDQADTLMALLTQRILNRPQIVPPPMPQTTIADQIAAGALAALDPAGYEQLVAPRNREAAAAKMRGFEIARSQQAQEIDDLQALMAAQGLQENRRLTHEMQAQGLAIRQEAERRQQKEDTRSAEKERVEADSRVTEAANMAGDAGTSLMMRANLVADAARAIGLNAEADSLQSMAEGAYDAVASQFANVPVDTGEKVQIGEPELKGHQARFKTVEDTIKSLSDELAKRQQLNDREAFQREMVAVKEEVAKSLATFKTTLRRPLPAKQDADFSDVVEGAWQAMNLMDDWFTLGEPGGIDTMFTGLAFDKKQAEFRRKLQQNEAKIRKFLFGTAQTLPEAENNWAFLSQFGKNTDMTTLESVRGILDMSFGKAFANYQDMLPNYMVDKYGAKLNSIYSRGARRGMFKDIYMPDAVDLDPNELLIGTIP